MYCVDEINHLNKNEFIKVFSNVVEHCLDCAIVLNEERPFLDVENIKLAANKYLDGLNAQEKEEITKKHPDLAGKLSEQNKLTNESCSEQVAAGLNKLSHVEIRTLQQQNEKYKAKFGFPFVICARENKFKAILEGLSQRMENSRDVEIATALEEIKKIVFYRIQNIVKVE